MKLSRYLVAALLAAGMMIGQAYAGGSKCSTPCGKAKKLSTAVTAEVSTAEAKAALVCNKQGQGCSKALVTEVLYRVDDLETPCAKTAAAAAQQNGGKIEYIAGGKVYATEDEAKFALAQQLEAAIEDVFTVRFAVGDECVSDLKAGRQLAAKTGKPVRYCVGGREFESYEAAEAAIVSAKAAAEARMGGGAAVQAACQPGCGKQAAIAASSARPAADVRPTASGCCHTPAAQLTSAMCGAASGAACCQAAAPSATVAMCRPAATCGATFATGTPVVSGCCLHGGRCSQAVSAGCAPAGACGHSAALLQQAVACLRAALLACPHGGACAQPVAMTCAPAGVCAVHAACAAGGAGTTPVSACCSQTSNVGAAPASGQAACSKAVPTAAQATKSCDPSACSPSNKADVRLDTARTVYRAVVESLRSGKQGGSL